MYGAHLILSSQIQRFSGTAAMSADHPAVNIPPYHTTQRRSFFTLSTLVDVLTIPFLYTAVIFVWVGAWVIVEFYWFGSDRDADIGYMFLGLTVMIVTHSFLPQSGLDKISYRRDRISAWGRGAPFTASEYL